MHDLKFPLPPNGKNFRIVTKSRTLKLRLDQNSERLHEQKSVKSDKTV